jgi:putative transposase
VLEIAKLAGFGYTRIIGEMRKLGIKGISRQTVRNILKEEGIVPAPDRTSDKWENFLEPFGSVGRLTSRRVTASRYEQAEA